MKMKIKLTEPPRLFAVDKKTGKEYGVRGLRMGPLDKNQTGVEVTLDKGHNGYPVPRKWDEVEVWMELTEDMVDEIVQEFHMEWGD